MHRAYGSRLHLLLANDGLKSLSDLVIQAGVVTRCVEATPLASPNNCGS